MKKALEYIILIFGLLIGIIGLFSVADTMRMSDNSALTVSIPGPPPQMLDLKNK